MNLPPDFIDTIKSQLGKSSEAFFASLELPSPVSIRLNPSKRIHTYDTYERVTWATDAFYLPERISFTLDPLFHSGCYYVQEASSMFLENVIRQITTPGTPVKILDLCAAPGGKSTHTLSTLSSENLLVSNELISSRNNILQQNLTKWGNSNVIVTQNDAADFARLPGFFDIIIADVPCSGEGLFRKQADAVDEWSIDGVNNCSARQAIILDSIYDSLKEGGYIIYSTCTYEFSENENQIARMCEKYKMEQVAIINSIDGIISGENGLRFYPHNVKGEGFFISLLRKKEHSDGREFRNRKSKPDGDKPLLSKFLNHSEEFISFRKNDELYAFPLVHEQNIQLLMDNLFVRKAGIHIGTIKGKDIVPGHELALSLHLNKDITRVELTLQEAQQYLRCDTLNLSNIPTGWAVVTFKNFPMGWIKGIGNRINNYFPRSLRVLKQQ